MPTYIWSFKYVAVQFGYVHSSLFLRVGDWGGGVGYTMCHDDQYIVNVSNIGDRMQWMVH